MKYILSILAIAVLPLYSHPIKVRTKIISAEKAINLPEDLKKLSKMEEIEVITLPSILLTTPKTQSIKIISEKEYTTKLGNEFLGVTYSISVEDKGDKVQYDIKLKFHAPGKLNKPESNIRSIDSKTYLISGVALKDQSIWIPLGNVHFKHNHDAAVKTFSHIQGGISKLQITFDKQKKENKME